MSDTKVKHILVTGGAVHANLDAVKIITNRFKGGYMAELARNLGNATWLDEPGWHTKVTYLTTKGSKLPVNSEEANLMHNFAGNVEVVYHNGFEDYRRLVMELAPKMDAVILGAAVCNLIPKTPWKEKFPSHLYRVGDEINVPFVIAPRVVDEVKKVMKPGAHLFAFKLLAGVAHEELIEAAYDIVLESGATAVFANDATNLKVKYAVTKEHGVHKYLAEDYHTFILKCLADEYYRTVIDGEVKGDDIYTDGDFKDLVHPECTTGLLKKRYKEHFSKTYGKKKYVFGTIAVRLGNGAPGFITTSRGKKEINGESVWVKSVDHEKRIVNVFPTKATLNAPLLDFLFKNNPNVDAIVHYHGEPTPGMPIEEYAPPGTVRDSIRKVFGEPLATSFAIEDHGVFLLLDKEGNVI